MNKLFRSAKKDPKMMRMIIDTANSRKMINFNEDDEYNFRFKHKPRRYDSYNRSDYEASLYELPTYKNPSQIQYHKTH